MPANLGYQNLHQMKIKLKSSTLISQEIHIYYYI
jgi:hypothetical protein